MNLKYGNDLMWIKHAPNYMRLLTVRHYSCFCLNRINKQHYNFMTKNLQLHIKLTLLILLKKFSSRPSKCDLNLCYRKNIDIYVTSHKTNK